MSRRRNIYPHDPSDPNLRWCKDCNYPYMPAGGCTVHARRCLTCCSVEGLQCATGVTNPEVAARRAGEIVNTVVQEDIDRVQADIDALYGKDGER